METSDQGDLKEMVQKRVESENQERGTKMMPGTPGDVSETVSSKFVMECLAANELGDGLLYCELNKGKFLYSKLSGEWYCWAGHHWALDVQEMSRSAVERVAEAYISEVHRLVEKINWISKSGQDKALISKYQGEEKQLYRRVMKLRSYRGRTNCLEFAKTNDVNALSILGDQIDQQPWLLACPNGVVELRTGELRDGWLDDFLLKACPTEYRDIEEPAPIWERFLSDIFEEDLDLIGYMQRLFGYAMTGLSVEHILPILWGQGRNGKGTLIETISEVLGPLCGPVPAEMLLNQGQSKAASSPTPDIMALRGQRMVFASETDDGRRFSTSRIKWFSGGDTLVGRSPHDRYQTTFHPTHTLFLLTNNKPHAPADDFAFWERVHLIETNLSFVDREPATPNERRADKYLREKLQREASGILSWLVRGCLRWQEQGLNPPARVKEATQSYKREEDFLADWIEEACYLDPNAKTASSVLYDSFKEWWSENVSRKNPPTHNTFGKWMKKKFERKKISTYFYFGIRLLH